MRHFFAKYQIFAKNSFFMILRIIMILFIVPYEIKNIIPYVENLKLTKKN